MRPRLHVRCLGEPLLLDHLRRPIRLRVRKHVALVFFLVLEPRHKATRERLRRLLWPDGNSAQSLSQAIVELRRGLGADVFEVTDHHLALRPDADITTDLQMLHTGAGELMVRELSQSFWSHVLFDGYEFDDADEWNSWLALERERWRDRLGRLAVDVSRTGEWARDSADRLRLRLWGTYLLGEVTSHTIARAEAGRARWDHVDLRVFDVDRLLPTAPPTLLAVTGAIQADAMAVVLAAVRHREGRVVASLLDDALAPATALATTILGLPGWVAAAPEAVALVQRLADGEPLTEAALAAMRDVLDTVREECAVALVAPRVSVELLSLVAQVDTRAHTLRGLWLLTREAVTDGAALPPGAAQLAVEPASMDRLLEVAGRLAETEVSEAGLREALRRSHGSVALLAVLLRGAARTTPQGVTLQVASPSPAARAALLREWTDLPARLSADLAALADRPTDVSPVGWGSPNGARRSAADRPSLVDGLPQALLWEDPSALLARLEDAVDRGDASGRSVNAALLATRMWVGVAHPLVVSECIENRCSEASSQGEDLEAAEALAFALLMSGGATNEHLSNVTYSALISAPETSLATHAMAWATAKIVAGQKTRDDAVYQNGLDQLSRAQPDGREEQLFASWVSSFARGNHALRKGDYSAALNDSTQLIRIAHERGEQGALNSALLHRLACAYRVGRYSDVSALASTIGMAGLNAKAKALGAQPILAVRAAAESGDLRRFRGIFDTLEEHLIYGGSLRARLLGAEFLAVTGRVRRANQLAEQAFELFDSTPLLEQQGLWSKWAAKVLPTDSLEKMIHSLLLNPVLVDPREQVVVYRSASQRGVLRLALEDAGFNRHALPEPAFA